MAVYCDCSIAQITSMNQTRLQHADQKDYIDVE